MNETRNILNAVNEIMCIIRDKAPEGSATTNYVPNARKGDRGELLGHSVWTGDFNFLETNFYFFVSFMDEVRNCSTMVDISCAFKNIYIKISGLMLDEFMADRF